MLLEINSQKQIRVKKLQLSNGGAKFVCNLKLIAPINNKRCGEKIVLHSIAGLQHCSFECKILVIYKQNIMPPRGCLFNYHSSRINGCSGEVYASLLELWKFSFRLFSSFSSPLKKTITCRKYYPDMTLPRLQKKEGCQPGWQDN